MAETKSNKSMLTNDSLLTHATGERITEADKIINRDWNILSKSAFARKYGLDTAKSFEQQDELVNTLAVNTLAMNDRTNLEATGDMVKNVIAGGLRGLTGTAAFAGGLVNDSLGEGLARLDEGVGNISDALGSDVEKIRKKVYGIRQAGLKNRINREYEQDIANGKSVGQAELSRMGKEFTGSISNILKTGRTSEITGNALGSILSGGAISKLGVATGSKLAPTFSKYLPNATNTVKNSVNALRESGKLGKRIVEDAPWALSMGAQEGGGQYSQTLLEGLNRSFTDLYANSPEFVKAVEEYTKNNVPIEEAREAARSDVAHAAADLAALKTGAAAVLLNYGTAPISKAFTRAKGSPYRKFVGEAVGEPFEELGTETAGQIFENMAVRDYLDKNQNIYEGAGQAGAEGFMGGMGILGTRAGIGAVPTAAKITGDTVAEAVKVAKEGKEAVGDFVTNLSATESNARNAISYGRESKIQSLFGAESDEQRTVLNGQLNSFEGAVNLLHPKDADNKPIEPTPSDAFAASNAIITAYNDIDSLYVKDDNGNVDYTSPEGKERNEFLDSVKDSMSKQRVRANNVLKRNLRQKQKAYKDGKIPATELFEAAILDFINKQREYTYNLKTTTDPQKQQQLTDKLTEDSKNLSNIFSSFTKEDRVAISKYQSKDPIVNSYLDSTFQRNAQPTPSTPATPNTPSTPTNPNTPSNPNAPNPPVNPGTPAPSTETVQNTPMDIPDPVNQPTTVDLDGTTPSTPTVPTENISEGSQEISSPEKVVEKTQQTEDLSQYATELEGTRLTKDQNPDLEGYLDSLVEHVHAVKVLGDDIFFSTFKPGHTDSFATSHTRIRSKNSKIGLDSEVGLITFGEYKEDPKTRTRYWKKAFTTTPEQIRKWIKDHPNDYQGSFDPEHYSDVERATHSMYKELTKAQEKPKDPNDDGPGSGTPAPKKDSIEDSTEAKELEDILNEREQDEDDVRAYIPLSPKKQEEKGVIVIDGQMDTLGSAKLENAFSSVFGDHLSEVFRPLKRILPLWGNAKYSPTSVLKTLLSNKDTFSKFLRGNKFTNSGTLINALFQSKSGMDTNPKAARDYDPHASLAQNILTMLDRNSMFMKPFRHISGQNSSTEQGLLDYQDGDPNFVRDILFEDVTSKLPDGTTKTVSKMKLPLASICSIAGLHMVAAIDAMPHDLTESEMARLGLKIPDGTTVEDVEGIPTIVAAQHAATAIRKIMGIAPRADASEHEIQTVLGVMAAKTLDTLIKAEILIEKDLPVTVLQNGKYETITIKQLVVSPDFHKLKLFRPKATILTTLTDPSYKNTINTSAPKVNVMIQGTNEAITNEQEARIAIANNQANRLNMPLFNMYSWLGLEGVAKFMGKFADADTRHLFSKKDYITKQGQMQSMSLAFDYLSELVFNFASDALPSLKLYFDNRAIRNGRIMQIGAATQQNNKTIREALVAGNEDPMDIETDSDTKTIWMFALAQSLGEHINDKTPSQISKQITSALQSVKQILEDNPQLKEDLKTLIYQGRADNYKASDRPIEDVNFALNALNQFVSEFNTKNKDNGVSIEGDRGLSALAEMVRYTLEPDQRKSFLSNLYLEIDGINDGPSYINTVLGNVMGPFTEMYFTNSSKTGHFFGVSAITQLALNKQVDKLKAKKKSELTDEEKEILDTAEITGGGGKDFHAEIAGKKVTEYVLNRITEAAKLLSNTSPNMKSYQTAKMQLKVTKAMMTIFKAINWIDIAKDDNGKELYSIDDILKLTKLPADPTKYPFKFDREISKKLVTVIPYGSQTRGSTSAVLDLMLRAVYSSISEHIQIADSHTTNEHIKEFNDFEKDIQGTTYVIDTETTGTNTRESDVGGVDAIVQISVRKLVNGVEQEARTYWIPEPANKKIPEHFIDNRTGKVGAVNPMFAEHKKHTKEFIDITTALKQVKRFVGNKPLIGHNIKQFDIALLNYYSKGDFKNRLYDTRDLARVAYPKSRKSSKYAFSKLNGYSQQELAKFFNFKQDNTAHLADSDTAVNIQLVNQLRKDGPVTIKFLNEHELGIDPNADENNFNGVLFSDLMGAFRELFNTEISRFGNYSFNDTIKIETDRYGVDQENHVNDKGKTLAKSLHVGPLNYNERGIRSGDFEVTPEGHKHLTDLFIPVFGTPAQEAVNVQLGTQAMKASMLPAVVFGIVNHILGAIEKIEDVAHMSREDADEFYTKYEALVPSLTFDEGNKIVVEKTSFTTDNVLYTTPDGKVPYAPSMPNRLSAELAGSPLFTQALGDGTTAGIALEESSKANVNFANIYDGFNTMLLNVLKMGEIANQASNRATQQEVMSTLYDKVKEVNQNLKEYFTENGVKVTSSKDAKLPYLTQALVNLSKGLDILGKGLKDKQASESFQKDLYKYLHSFNKKDSFVDSYAQELANKRIDSNEITSKIRVEDRNIEATVENELNEFFETLEVISFNERIKQKTLQQIGKTTQHMSAYTTTYKTGQPISIKDAKALLESVNSKLPSNRQFSSFNALLANFMNHLLYKNFMENYANRLPSAFKTKWMEFVGFNTPSGFVNPILLPTDVFNEIASSLEVKEFDGKTPVKITPKKGKTTKVSHMSCQQLFTNLAANARISKIMKAVYHKIRDLIPKDVNVEIFSDISDIPKEVQSHFTNPNQRGVFILKNNTIYIKATKGANGKTIMDPNHPENATVIMHELVHSVISNLIEDYYLNPNSLTASQRKAIENLEKLLNDLIANVKNIGNPTIEHFLFLLNGLYGKEKSDKDKARLLDEAITYLLTSTDLFVEGSITNIASKSHLNRLYSLLNKVADAIKNVIFAALNILPGSVLGKKFGEQKGSMPLTDLVGANVLVALADEDVDNPRPPKKKLVRDKQNKVIRASFGENFFKEGFTKAMFTASFPFDASTIIRKSSDFRNNIKRLASVSAQFNTALQKQFKKAPDATLKNLYTEKTVLDELNRVGEYKRVIRETTKHAITFATDFAETVAMYQLPYMFSSEDISTMSKVYGEVVRKLTPDFLIKDPAIATQEDIDRSNYLYNLILGKEPLLNENIEHPKFFQKQWERQAVLFALAKVEPAVAAAISSIKFNKISYRGKYETPLEAIDRISESMMSKIDADKVNSSNSLNEIIDKAAEDNRSKLEQGNTEFFADKPNIWTALNNFAIYLIAIPYAFGTKHSISVAHKIFSNILKSPIGTYNNSIVEPIRTFVNSKLPQWAVDLVKGFYGRTPSNTQAETLLKSVNFFDRTRLEKLTNLPKRMLKSFKKYNVTLQTRHFLHRTLGATDITTLDEATARKVLTSSKDLDAEIAKIEARIKKHRLGSLFKEYQRKCKQLANFLTGDRKPGVNLLTNAYAIARLLTGLDKVDDSLIDSVLVHDLDILITLYAIKNLSEGDIAQLQEFYTADGDAMKIVYDQLAAAKEAEADRSETRSSKLYKLNSIKGWLPNGVMQTGSYLIIPKKLQKDYEKQGYIVLGDYKADSLDHSEPMVRIYNSNPHMKKFQEGIIQTINQTAFGFQVDERARREAYGTRIGKQDVLSYAVKHFNRAREEENNLIPLYNEEGYIYGFERAIPAEDRQYLEKGSDLFSGIAQLLARQERESEATKFIDRGIQYAKEDYESATPKERREQFVDVLHTDNTAMQIATKRIDFATRKKMNEAFGGKDVFYVRKDLVWTYIGYERSSITDMWDTTFMIPKSTQKLITKLVDDIFPHGRYYLGMLEEHWMGAVSWVRDTIIIRSGVVPVANYVGNFLTLNLVLGIPATKLYKMYKKAWLDTQEYERKMTELEQVKFELTSATGAKAVRLEKKKIALEAETKGSPLYELIKQGEYSSISSEGASYGQVEHTKNFIENTIMGAVSKSTNNSERVKSIASELLMTKGSNSYKTMAYLTNLGDWLAKAVCYEYLTKGSPALDPATARNIASILFVDYDQFASKSMDYFNRMGVTHFMFYKHRMVPAAILSLLLNPARAVLGTALASSFGLPGTALTENVVAKIASGDITYSLGLGMMVKGIALHPLAVVLDALTP